MHPLFGITTFFVDVRKGYGTLFLQGHFGVRSLSSNTEEVSSAIYLQVSIISQALIFVTRSQSWSFLERPGILLMCAFVVAQLVRCCTSFLVSIFFFQIQNKLNPIIQIKAELVGHPQFIRKRVVQV